MKKLSLLLLMTIMCYLANAQCGKFNWTSSDNDDITKRSSYERNERKNDSLRIGNSLYLVSTKDNFKLGLFWIDDLFIDKFNYKTLEFETKKSIVKSEVSSFMKATGIDPDKEFFEGSIILSDRIIVITTVKPKKQMIACCIARIISPELEVEKYIVFDTLKLNQKTCILPWGDGLLFTYYSMEDKLRNKPISYYFQSYDKNLNPTSDLITYQPKDVQNMNGMEGIIGMEKEGVVIAETYIKGGEALALFDLKNMSMGFYNLDIKERVSDFKYKLNKDGDLVCAVFYLSVADAKNLPDVQGIYLRIFFRGTLENKYSCKIPIKPETFGNYCASSINIHHTYLRYLKLVDICFNSEGNTVIAGEIIDDSHLNNHYSKGEIIVYTINNSCEITDEHHIAKMLVQTWNADVSAAMFGFSGSIYVVFRDNPANLNVYDKNQVQNLDEKNRGMLVLAKLNPSGEYSKKCLVSQEENFPIDVHYFPNQLNNSEDLLFKRYDGFFGRYIIDKE